MSLKVTNPEHKIKSVGEQKQLCELWVKKTFPKQMWEYIDYVRKLGFTDVPNYKYLRDLLRTLAVDKKIEYDNKWDWEKEEELAWKQIDTQKTVVCGWKVEIPPKMVISVPSTKKPQSDLKKEQEVNIILDKIRNPEKSIIPG